MARAERSTPLTPSQLQFALDAMKAFRKLHQHLFQTTPKLVTVHDRGANSDFWDEFDNV